MTEELGLFSWKTFTNHFQWTEQFISLENTPHIFSKTDALNMSLIVSYL